MIRSLVLSSAALSLAACEVGSVCMLPPIPAPPGVTKKDGVTYYKDVQPIMKRSCQGCHVSGVVGPVPLTSYDEAFQNSGPISAAGVGRRMPPWKPAYKCE